MALARAFAGTMQIYRLLPSQWNIDISLPLHVSDLTWIVAVYQFDCSGLVQWSYEQAGLSLPASTKTQVQEGQSVSESELKPGDVIFFYSPISHNGIYIGGGNVVHAPTEGQDVKVESYKDIGDVNKVRRFAG